MTNSLMIGKVIYQKLSESTKLTELLGNSIYPIIADNDAKFPFIVYKRISIISIGTKDGFGEDEVTYEVTVVSDKYPASIEIANEVRKVLEKQKIQTDLMTLYNNKINGVTEEYDSNVYIQRLTFNCRIN